MPLILSLLVPSAHAFCGTFVSAGDSIVNTASQVAIVRQGQRTTLTMANDFEGDLDEFAMLVPVPVVLTEDDVRVLSPKVFENLDGYSQPRLVSYTCEELYPEPPPRDPVFSCGGMTEDYAVEAPMAMDEESGGVTVESQFIVGEYEIVVLSAEESGGLLSWLDDNGYAVSSTASELLQEYIESGSYFFAAKVFTTRMPTGQESLSPLQFSYDSEAFGLPIRLGTANAVDAQELVAYVLTDPEGGRVGIANYEETELEEVCLVDGEDFAGFYAELFDEAMGEDAKWTVEYGWNVGDGPFCDPCSNVGGLPISDILSLGYIWDADGEWWDDWGDSGLVWEGTAPSFYFTRLHMRYSPEQATEDLVLYASGVTDNTQQRYVEYQPYLEAEFPICGSGWVADPQSCADEDPKYARRMRAQDREEADGCAAESSAPFRGSLLLLVLGAVFGARRRRS